MKYRIAILTVIMAICAMGTTLWGDNVDLKRARHTAATYLSSVTGSKTSAEEARLVYALYNPIQPGVSTMYLFNMGNSGFVAVAGSDNCDPILAFDEFDTLDINNIPPAMIWWMNSLSDQVSQAQNEQISATAEIATKWEELDKETLPVRASKANIILMTEKWNQVSSNDRYPTYNAKCPDSAGYYCPVGCGATALGQIMHYWQYPKQGAKMKAFPWPSWNSSGRRTTSNRIIYYKYAHYDYSLMPNQISNSSPQATIDTVATFNMHVATAMDMTFNPDGSSSTIDDAISAARNYFKYQNTMQILYRINYYNGSENYTSDQWTQILRDEIDANRPIYYSGHDYNSSGRDAGHAFICHGYRTDDTRFFRFNWGWGGSGDAWYNVANIHGLNPNHQYDFSSIQNIITHIMPPDDSNRFMQNIVERTVEQTQLLNAHPNPSRTTITIPYTLSGNSQSEMVIMDISGKVVDRIKVQPGQHEVTLRVSNYAKGLYVYRLAGKSRKFMVQ